MHRETQTPIAAKQNLNKNGLFSYIHQVEFVFLPNQFDECKKGIIPPILN